MPNISNSFSLVSVIHPSVSGVLLIEKRNKTSNSLCSYSDFTEVFKCIFKTVYFQLSITIDLAVDSNFHYKTYQRVT